MSLADLKKNAKSALNVLKEQAEKEASKQQSYDDDRFWKPTFDEEKGTGSATVRLMPAPEGEESPKVKVYSHEFKGKVKWYIENSLTNIGSKDDPVSSLNRRLWETGIESDKAIARNQKRKTSYYVNVKVLKDPARPECEGKVYLWKIGPEINKIIENAMFPEFEDIEPMNPFDPWDGANFNIRMIEKTKMNGKPVPTYEKSSFGSVSCMGSDEEIEASWKTCHSLAFFLSEDNYKKPGDLKKRLLEVLGPVSGSGVPTVEGLDDIPAPKSAPVPKESKPAKTDVDDIPAYNSGSVDDDDDLAFLKDLVD
jgi:hypothetical protein